MDLVSQRLKIQQISEQQFKTPAQLVSHFCAMQAQDYYGSKWAIGLRLHGSTDETISKAIAKRQIVRTWPMRGTLHFVAAADVKWLQQLLAPRIIKRSAPYLKQIGLETKTVVKSAGIISKALEGGRQLRRSDIYELLEQKGIRTGNYHGIHILGQLAMQSMLCLGAHDDKQPTYALLDEWVTKHQEYEAEEALAVLAIRYFKGHGPATAQDLAWWSGLTLTEAKKAIALAENKLHTETIEGVQYYFTGNIKTSNHKLQTANSCLLPPFDEYLLGYADKNRGLVLSDEHVPAVIPGKNGLFMPTILADGRIAGTWKRILKKDSVEIQLKPFYKLSKAETQDVKVSAREYADFLNLKIDLKM